MGLGDKGLEGINQFKLQHICNSICKDLQLPSITQEDEAPPVGTENDLADDIYYHGNDGITNNGTGKEKTLESNI